MANKIHFEHSSGDQVLTTDGHMQKTFCMMQNAKINANYIFCIDVKMQNANLLFCINVTMQMQKLFAFCIDFKCKCKIILLTAAEIRLEEMILTKISQKMAV